MLPFGVAFGNGEDKIVRARQILAGHIVELQQELRVAAGGREEDRRRNAAHLGGGDRLRAEPMFRAIFERDELAGRFETDDLAASIAEQRVQADEPDSSPHRRGSDRRPDGKYADAAQACAGSTAVAGLLFVHAIQPDRRGIRAVGADIADVCAAVRSRGGTIAFISQQLPTHIWRGISLTYIIASTLAWLALLIRLKLTLHGRHRRDRHSAP